MIARFSFLRQLLTLWSRHVIIWVMIRTFRDQEAELLFKRYVSRKIPLEIQRVAMRKLWMLDAAIDVKDLRTPPSNHLELLRGDRKGQYSIRINRQFRICFFWKSGHAYEVEIIDYH